MNTDVTQDLLHDFLLLMADHVHRSLASHAAQHALLLLLTFCTVTMQPLICLFLLPAVPDYYENDPRVGRTSS